MMIEEVVEIFADCGACRFASMSRIRPLKKMITETIKSNTAKMINRSSAFFLICMVTVTKNCERKLALNSERFQVLRATKSGQRADKMLTEA
jgi:pyruvate kinase